ncbi:hypothetical protein Tco_1186739, partial [Tanacetum coccineum]
MKLRLIVAIVEPKGYPHDKNSNVTRVPDVPTYKSDDEQISWKSSDKDDDDEVSLNDDDDDNDDDDNNDDDED